MGYDGPGAFVVLLNFSWRVETHAFGLLWGQGLFGLLLDLFDHC